ncbi:hypothetical protein T09_8845 [Trichinella sp. T9]|nr:hypothetical protein T09_8845 [Trichinella sp. T9]
MPRSLVLIKVRASCRIVRVGRICVYDLQSSKVGEEGKKKEDQADKTASKQFPCHAATTGTDGEVEQPGVSNELDNPTYETTAVIQKLE